MGKNKIFLLVIIGISAFCHLGEARKEIPIFEISPKPLNSLAVGEKLIYGIRYLGMKIGEAQAEIKEIKTIQGREAFYVVIQVRSNKLIDAVYKVRDIHYVYIDKKELCLLRYEKNLQEGFTKKNRITVYDRAKSQIRVWDEKGNLLAEGTVPVTQKNTIQDEVSCGYWFRTRVVAENTQINIPVFAQGKFWNLIVKTHQASSLVIKDVGKFTALEVEPVMPFQGIFVRKGKIRGWISLDNRRIPLAMDVKIPVIGTVRAVLEQYTPGK